MCYVNHSNLIQRQKQQNKYQKIWEPIIKVYFVMSQIAAIHSHVCKWWTNILTCMIEKDPGYAKIHQLRVIRLYKYNSNLLLGLFLCEMDQ